MNSQNLFEEIQNEISELIKFGELLKAQDLCTSALKKFPEEMILLRKLSSIFESMGKIDLAQQALEKNPVFLEDAAFLNGLMIFYLRNKDYVRAKSILDKANQSEFQDYKSKKITKKMSIVFNSSTKRHEANIEVTKNYIKKYPKDAFGYLYYIKSIDYLKFSQPEELQNIFNSIHEQIKDRNISIRITKILLRKQSKFYSLLEINDREIADSEILEGDKINLLIGRLHLLLNLQPDTEEIDHIVSILLAENLSINELNRLLQDSRRYELLESKLIQYIDQNTQWLEYISVRKQVSIIKQCRSLKTDQPLPESVNKFPHPVDVVYTWCDMEDPVFAAKFKAQNGFDLTQSNDRGTGKCRYINSQEIKLSLASLFKYFQDVNRVYIVTNEQQFELDFLSVEQQRKISFVNHSEIMPHKYIKGDVFNSNLIAAFLWNVSNLQENFIYFNDDVILGNYLQPHHLFDQNGTSLAMTQPRKHHQNLELNKLIDFQPQESIPWDISIANAIEQFEAKNGTTLPFLNMHQGVPMVRSECAKAFHKYKDIWQQEFFQEMLRGEHSVCSTLIYVWEAAISGNQKLGEYDRYNRYSTIFSSGLNQENIRYIKQVKPLFYCLNHIGDKTSRNNLHDLTDSILGIHYPPHLYELADYISSKTNIENIIYISVKSSAIHDRIQEKINIIEVDLSECCISHDLNSLYNPAIDLNLLSSKLAIDNAVLEKSAVICTNAIARLPNPNLLIDTLAKWSDICRYIFLTAPNCERIPTIADTDLSKDLSHSIKWTLPEFCRLLSSRNFPVGLSGHTITDHLEDSKGTSLVISGKEAVYVPKLLVPVTAIINCYNEADIIRDVVLYLVEQDINIVIADNWSNDGSYEILQQLAEQYPSVTVTRFPDAPINYFNLSEQLINTVNISEQLGHGWYLHYDADEIRESPWQGINLREAISFVDSLGYNAIDFTILNFRYLKENRKSSDELLTKRLRYCHFIKHQSDFGQVKSWKYYGQTVNLKDSGGHNAKFENQQVYPLKFLTRHYPLRSQEQAHQKLFQDRFPRFRFERQQLKRHVHYDRITKKQLEGWNKEYLFLWDSKNFSEKYLIERISGIGLSAAQPREETSATYEEAIKTDPNDPRLHYILAKTRIEERNVEKAILSSRKAFELDPESVDITEQLSQLLMEVKQESKALSLVTTLLESQPDNPRLHLILGRTYFQQQEYKHAIACYQQAIELDSSQSAAVYTNLGVALAVLKQTNGALQAHQQAIEIEPDNVPAYIAFGDFCRQEKDFKNAASYYFQAIKLNCKNVEVHFALGQVLREQKRIEEAIVAYQNTLSLQPEHFHTYVSLGHCYRQQQKPEQAILFYKKSLELHSNKFGIWFALGQVLREQKRIEEAIAAYQNTLSLQPEHFHTYVGLGHCYRQQQKPEQAILAYQKSLELHPDKFRIWFALGQVLREQKRIEEAIVAYQNTLSLQPEHFNARLGLKHCYRQQKRLN